MIRVARFTLLVVKRFEFHFLALECDMIDVNRGVDHAELAALAAAGPRWRPADDPAGQSMRLDGRADGLVVHRIDVGDQPGKFSQ